MIRPDETFFCLIDVQQKLFPHMDRGTEVLNKIMLTLQGAKLMGCPIFCTEQSPEKLGGTLPSLLGVLGHDHPCFAKETFSAVGEEELVAEIGKINRPYAVLLGIETHVCILQTAYQLLDLDIEPIIVSDATTSRHIYDFSSAISEFKDEGIRVTSAETLLFQLTRSAKAPWFKDLQKLIKGNGAPCCSI